MLFYCLTCSKMALRVQSIFFSPPLQSVRKTIHTQDVQVYRDFVGHILGSSFRSNNSILQYPLMESLRLCDGDSINMDWKSIVIKTNCDWDLVNVREIVQIKHPSHHHHHKVDSKIKDVG